MKLIYKKGLGIFLFFSQFKRVFLLVFIFTSVQSERSAHSHPGCWDRRDREEAEGEMAYVKLDSVNTGSALPEA